MLRKIPFPRVLFFFLFSTRCFSSLSYWFLVSVWMALVALQDLSRYSNIFFIAHFLRPVFSFSSWSSSLLLLLLFLLRFLRRRAGIFVFFRPGNTFQSFYFLSFVSFLNLQALYPVCIQKGTSSSSFPFSSSPRGDLLPPFLSYLQYQCGWLWLHCNPFSRCSENFVGGIFSPSCIDFPSCLPSSAFSFIN